MATPKFPLTMGDGTKVRTLEELQAHADLYTLEQCFDDQRLLKWLSSRGYEEQRVKLEALQEDAEDFHQQLCGVLGIPWMDKLENEYQEQKMLEAKAEQERQGSTLYTETPLGKTEDVQTDHTIMQELSDKIIDFLSNPAAIDADKVIDSLREFFVELNDAVLPKSVETYVRGICYKDDGRDLTQKSVDYDYMLWGARENANCWIKKMTKDMADKRARREGLPIMEITPLTEEEIERIDHEMKTHDFVGDVMAGLQQGICELAIEEQLYQVDRVAEFMGLKQDGKIKCNSITDSVNAIRSFIMYLLRERENKDEDIEKFAELLDSDPCRKILWYINVTLNDFECSLYHSNIDSKAMKDTVKMFMDFVDALLKKNMNVILSTGVKLAQFVCNSAWFYQLIERLKLSMKDKIDCGN